MSTCIVQLQFVDALVDALDLHSQCSVSAHLSYRLRQLFI